MNSQDVYQQLLEAYGYQGWWPILQRSSWQGYGPEGYHPEIYELVLQPHERFEIITGAILTQNTSWTNVRSSLTKLLKHCTDHQKRLEPTYVLTLEHEELAELVRSSGYFNQKTKKLKGIADFFEKRGTFNTGLESAQSSGLSGTPSRDELLSLWGIGPETADSILLYAYNEPTCVVDAYSLRIFSRLECSGTANKRTNLSHARQSPGPPGPSKAAPAHKADKAHKTNAARWTYETLQMKFHAELENDPKVYNEFHALLVEHGKQYCTLKNQKCNICPLKLSCSFVAQNS